jgi:hypothetical protein
MRWRFSSIALATLAVACAPVVRRWYLPEAGAERMGLDELRQAADLSLRAECPRLLRGGSSATGEALLTVEVDRSGTVLRSRVERSSGDPRIDDLFGTLATRMRLDRPTSMMNDTAEGTVAMGYSCAPNAAIATIRLNP